MDSLGIFCRTLLQLRAIDAEIAGRWCRMEIGGIQFYDYGAYNEVNAAEAFQGQETQAVVAGGAGERRAAAGGGASQAGVGEDWRDGGYVYWALVVPAAGGR